MKLLAGAALLLLSLSGFSQHQVAVNTNFFLTQRPVFMVGYSHSADSSQWSFGANAEFGRFNYSGKNHLSSQIDQEVSTGFGIMPEIRRYTRAQAFGLFATSFCQIRRFKTTEQHGVTLTPNGYQLENPEISVRKQTTMRYGVGVGYRSGCHASRLHLEVLTGAYVAQLSGEKRDFTSISHDEFDQYIRLELNLVAVF